MIDFDKNKKKIIKGAIKNMKINLGEKNTAILLATLLEACDYTFGKRGLKQVRQIEIRFNNFFGTKCDLTKGFNISHE